MADEIKKTEGAALVTVKLPPDVMNRSATTVLIEQHPFPTLKRERADAIPPTEETADK